MPNLDMKVVAVAAVVVDIPLDLVMVVEAVEE